METKELTQNKKRKKSVYKSKVVSIDFVTDLHDNVSSIIK